MSQYAELCGWLVYHTLNSIGSNPGFPDLVLVRGNRVLFVELKRDFEQKLRPAQEVWKDALNRANQVYFMWCPELLDGVINLLK